MIDEATEELLAEQLAYYRDGAQEYDNSNRRMLLPNGAEWWPEYRAGYDSAVALVRSACTGRDVLELAGGSGLYTAELALTASSLTVVDASPEALTINSCRVSPVRPNVRYVEADILDWQPPRRYEVVFFAFWLCHVPLTRFPEFWRTVGRALAPGGIVIVVDTVAQAPDGSSAGVAHGEDLFPERRVSEEVSVRTLRDGAEYRIVRILWERPELTRHLDELGWVATFDESSPWLVGTVRPRNAEHQRSFTSADPDRRRPGADLG